MPVRVGVVRLEHRDRVASLDRHLGGQLQASDLLRVEAHAEVTMGLDTRDGRQGDPAAVVVDGAHLTLAAMDEHQPRPARRCIQTDGAAAPAELPDATDEVVLVASEIDHGRRDRRHVR